MTTASASAPNPLRRLYAWVLGQADGPHGSRALAVISFAEASFFPMPPDVLQIALSVARPERSFRYAALSSAASVAGAVAGWCIGAGLWSAVSVVFFAWVPGLSAELFDQVRRLYLDNAFLAIVTAAFTPVPFKVFTLASGLFGVPLVELIAASALGRSARFFGVAACIRVAGPGVKRLLDRYLEVASIALLLLALAGFAALTRLD